MFNKLKNVVIIFQNNIETTPQKIRKSIHGIKVEFSIEIKNAKENPNRNYRTENQIGQIKTQSKVSPIKWIN